MRYRNLSECIADLERTGQLVRVAQIEVDPRLELAAIQRRAYAQAGPALLFPHVKGCAFPVLANLFGTMERARFIFRRSLPRVEALFAAKADPMTVFRRPWKFAGVVPALARMLPKKVKDGPVLRHTTNLGSLPQVVSWPGDGGAFITLPQVYTHDPDKPGFFRSNLGMYRAQISGNDYVPDKEAGLHYQIHRGIGAHHAKALAKGEDLPVNIFVGGPPAMTLAAVLPLPENIPELCLAGALAGRRIAVTAPGNGLGKGLPILAEADFCICGRLTGQGGRARTKPEGPFGDHLGYYSLTHDFPVLEVDAVYHRPDAVWPFTSVGRPPQEDTVFGAFIHELTAGLVPTVFSGIREVHAVDATGVHPLLLAIGSERYVPFAEERMPQELLTSGLGLFGNTQTSLAKYLLIAAEEDHAGLATRDVPGFFGHMLRRADFSRDLHFITRTTMDTLDYTGSRLNEGSKLLWAAAGDEKRVLATGLPADLALPEGFSDARLFAPGIMVCRGRRHAVPRDSHDPAMLDFAARLSGKTAGKDGELALVVVADDAAFTSASWDNFLWVAFTRSDPAADIYGPRESVRRRHWGCDAPLVIDARMKSFHAPPLEEDPDVARRVEQWGAPGGPLHGLV